MNLLILTGTVESLDIIFSKTAFYDSHKLNDSYLDGSLKDNGSVILYSKNGAFSFSEYSLT